MGQRSSTSDSPFASPSASAFPSGDVRIEVVDPEHPHARHCLDQFVAELGRRLPDGFDPQVSRAVDPDGLRPPAGLYLLATADGEPVGGAALRFPPGPGDDPAAEIKRLWVDPRARGRGVGRRLLAELEARAAARGRRRVQLDTSARLTEAVAMYRARGYREVEPFNDEPYADHWFEKDLQLGTDPGGTSAGA